MSMHVHDPRISGNVFLKGSVLQSSGEQLDAAVTASSPAGVSANAALTLTAADHQGKLILLNQTGGSTVTLPPARGSGLKLSIVVSNDPGATNSHVIQCAAFGEKFVGSLAVIDIASANAMAGRPAASVDDFDTLTLDHGPSGGIQGDVIEIQDMLDGVWAISGVIRASGPTTNPFSAALTP